MFSINSQSLYNSVPVRILAFLQEESLFYPNLIFQYFKYCTLPHFLQELLFLYAVHKETFFLL